jgi:hypothetical protein
MHGKDVIQSSWSGVDTTEGLNLGLYCLTCAVQGDQNSYAYLGSVEACFTEVWIDVGIAREGTGSDIEMPIGNDGREVEYNSQDPSTKYIRNCDFACVFQMRQDEGEGTSVSDIMLSMGNVNNPPNSLQRYVSQWTIEELDRCRRAGTPRDLAADIHLPWSK